jgi:hypothetical protein
LADNDESSTFSPEADGPDVRFACPACVDGLARPLAWLFPVDVTGLLIFTLFPFPLWIACCNGLPHENLRKSGKII